MPYFSLKDRADTDSDSESSMDSDGSYPELQTCPRVAEPASSKLPGISGETEKYFFAGRDCFSAVQPSSTTLRTPTPLLPKPAARPILPKPDSAPTPVIPKPYPFLGSGPVSVPKAPKPSYLQESSSVSVPYAPKPTPLPETSSVSVPKAPKPIAPKGPVPVTPGPSTSESGNFSWDVHSKLSSKAELLDNSSNSSVDSSIYKAWESNSDSSIGEGDVEAEPVQIVPPDWQSLLFGGWEKPCDEILTYPEVDTSYEDSKLAEDVALNFVANYNMPVFPCFSEFQSFNRVSHAVKNIPKTFGSRKEQLIALLVMFDYLSCCCQEGHLLHLYEKCKDKNKVYQLESLDQSLRLLLDRLHSDRLTLAQLRAVDSLVGACIMRIPKTMKPYFSAPQALKRKLKVFEMEDKNEKEHSVFNFTDVKSPPAKKPKVSKEAAIKSTSKKWELEDVDYKELLRTPTKSGPVASDGSPLLTSTPQSGWSVSGPPTSIKSPFKRDLLSTGSWDDKNGSSSKSSAAKKSVYSSVSDWLFEKENPPSKVNSGLTSLVSQLRETSEKLSGNSISKNKSYKPLKSSVDYGYPPEWACSGGSADSDDDSLPDIPVASDKGASSSYSTWKTKVLGNKSTQSSDSNLNSSEMKHQTVKDSSTPARKSPFKASHNTWKSKYESPSKLLLGKKY